MRIDILTIFPEMFGDNIKSSILGRALDNELIKIYVHDIREYAANKHKKVDDYPYGGGQGMVMSPQPLFSAIRAVLNEISSTDVKIVYFTPRGKVLKQNLALELVKHDHFILLCGHYEGIDQRIIDTFVDIEISIGDYILTGGELPALVFIDCISRLIPGVVGNPESIENESFSNNLLEYPHYTRPQVYEGLKVPDVLLSGNHKEIEHFRAEQSIKITKERRPDLLLD